MRLRSEYSLDGRQASIELLSTPEASPHWTEDVGVLLRCTTEPLPGFRGDTVGILVFSEQAFLL